MIRLEDALEQDKDEIQPKFTIIKETPIGRLGILECKHGKVETPAFVFCATKAAIKGASIGTMLKCDTQCLLVNTYNLMDFPGGDFLDQHCGAHNMMKWGRPMWSDSGGFQVFSLGYGRVSDEIKGKRSSTGFKIKIDEDGILFQSPRDGSLKKLTPEKSIQVQKQIGGDFIFVLDECTSLYMDKRETIERMRRSHRWEERSLKEHEKNPAQQGLYGIVQGGVYDSARQESIDFVNSKNFFGFGIGGSLGSLKTDMINILRICRDGTNGSKGLDKTRPKHLLGIGKLRNIEEAVQYDIDTFDCVHPTRLARHGGALVSDRDNVREYINLSNAKYKYDMNPIDSECKCMVCKTYTRSYIKYLLDAKEILATILLVEHNVFFMNAFMTEIRRKIQEWKD